MGVATLSSDLWILDQFGPVEPSTLLGPVRQGLGKFGDGLFLEEATTNLETNPNFAAALTGWTTTGSATQALSTLRAHSDVQSNRVTATAAAGGTQNSVTVVSGQAHSFSRYVFVESGSVNLVATVGATGTSATVTSAIPGWQRLTISNVTTTGVSVTLTVAAVGGAATFHVDDAQTEQKAYVTSYCDGNQATAWNAPGNLLPTAAQGFEDGTTASASVTGGTATLTNSAAQFYAGTKSLLATVTATASLTIITGPTGTAAAPVTAGKTHTASTWVRPSAARQLRADVNWYTAAGAFISATAGTAVTGVANTMTRQSVSAVAPATAAFAVTVFTSTDATNADTFYIDAQRVDEGSASAAYRWTGAENASTSTRAASQLVHASTTAPPLTMCALWRVGAAPTATVARPLLRLTGSGTAPVLVVSNTLAQFSSLVDVAANVSYVAAPGDLVFIAGVLAADGKTYTIYLSVNGGAVSTATSSASATAFTSPTTLTVGTDGNGTQYADGVIEQVLVYKAALSSVEIAALAASTNETAFKDDSRIVLAAATGTVRGTTRAVTLAGTGSWRGNRKVASMLETLSPTGANPDDDTATHKITVAAGSGVAAGQSVAYNPDGSNGTKFLISRVFTPGGDYDELYGTNVL